MVVNVNVGVLGHVDSGKTHLVKALSTQLSTAALDKHPQSQQRGITLDLGFSAFRLAAQEPSDNYELQITLVDCPGHASLFKTILGGVAIVDCVLLVVDVRKGVQPQTLECLLVAQLAVQHRIVIALNKIDTLPLATRALAVKRAQDDLRAFLDRHFPQLKAQEIAIVPVAVAPAAAEGEQGQEPQPIGLELLVQAIRSRLDAPTRDTSGPFIMAIDHCFAIQGNGTILTGTVLSGSLRLGDSIELAGLGLQKPVKSIQAFKQSVDRAQQGDRVGIRVNGLDASLVERGVAVSPQSMPFVRQVVVPVHRIAFFQSICKSGTKCHVTIGHTTAIAVITFFTRLGSEPQAENSASRDAFDASDLYEHVAQLDPIGAALSGNTEATTSTGSAANQRPLFVLLQLDRAILCLPDAIAVCARLDLNAKKFPCRLAFYGPIQGAVLEPSKTAGQQQMDLQSSRWQAKVLELQQLRIGRIKTRSGAVDKVTGRQQQQLDVIGKDMFAKDADLSVYLGTTVMCEVSKALLKIVSPFGKTGKFRLQLIDESPAGALPSPGERFKLRFLKVMALKSPAGQASKSVVVSSAVESSRKLLQDVRRLYPEAFTQPQLPDTEATGGDLSDASSGASLATELSSLSVAAAAESSSFDATELVSGTIERLKGETTSDGRNPFVIVSGLFASDTEALKNVGRTVFCRVSLPGNSEAVERGEIEKPFGKAGKVRVVFAADGGTLAPVGHTVFLQPY